MSRPTSVGWGCLEESEVEFCLFGHHVFVPFGFEDNADVDTFYSFDAFELDAGIVNQKVGGGAVGGL